MDGMATPKHAETVTRPRSRADIWFVLVLTGCASAFLQMWHATHSGSTAAVVDAVVGLVPAATAIGLSHAVVSHKAAVWLRVITVAVMLAFMAAAASASSAVVQPVEMRDFNWVFSLALDAAELACVWMLLGSSERKAAEAAAVETARREAAEAGKAVTEAVGKAAGLEAELAEARAALEAERARRLPARKPRRGSARKGAGTGTRNRVPVPAGSSAAEEMPDLDTEARILALIDQGHSASQAGILAGKSDSYGRQVARLRNAAKREPAGDERSDGDMATGEQPKITEHTEG